MRPEPPVSVDALHETLTWLQLAATALTPVGVDGAVVSVRAGVTTLATALRADSFPALSIADTVYACDVPPATPVSVALVVAASTRVKKTPSR